MTQLYRSSPNERQVPARSRLESARPTHEPSREADADEAELPVLLQLADFSHLSSRRASRRPALSLPQTATTLPVPPVTTTTTSSSIDDVRLASKPPIDPPRPKLHRESTRPHDPSSADDDQPPGRDQARVQLAVHQPEPLLETPDAAADTLASTKADPHPPQANSKLESNSKTPTTPQAQRASDDQEAPLADDESTRTVWDRVGSYRPSLPLLLGLVLATIGIAYIYRPQETPPKRRGSLDRTETKRQFNKDLDEQRPKSMSAFNDPLGSGVRGQPSDSNDDANMPVLDMPANAARNTTKGDAGFGENVGAPLIGPNRFPEDAAQPGSAADAATGSEVAPNNRAKLAARPKPLEHFAETAPPTMPGEPQIQPDGAGVADEDDDGPPPDVTGRSYPQTNSSNFFYRPLTPETREASRPIPSQGETR